MPIVDAAGWDAYVTSHKESIHLLQTTEWGELKTRFGWRVMRIVNGKFGVQVLLKPLPFGYCVAYAPRVAPEVVEQLANGALGKEIIEHSRNQKTVFLKVEPDCWDGEIPFGIGKFQISTHAIQPLRTVEIDLSVPEDAILAKMKQKCRYNIRLAEKKEIKITTRGDVEDFHALMEETGGRDGFEVHSKQYYETILDLSKPKGMSELFVAEFDGQPLAALMVFAVGKRSWYLYGASSDRERNRMPAYLLQWHAMLWAKNKGCVSYDMWGIPDENEANLERDFEKRNDGLWGVYRFKRGFGGKVLRAHPAMDLIFAPIIYQAYRLRQKIRGIDL